jgi:hypothetical protein
MMCFDNGLCRAAAFAAVALTLGTTARAQMIQYTPLFPGLYPTGYNSSGLLLPVSLPSSSGEGYVDGNYSVIHVYSFANGTAVTSTGSTYTKYVGAARVTQAYSGGWNSAVQNSQWIEPPGGLYTTVNGVTFYQFSGAGASAGAGLGFDYQIVFTVPSSYNLSTVTITGTAIADNYLDIYLNNDTSQTLQFNTQSNLYTVPVTFSLSSAQGLVLGVNTLTFYVFNIGTILNPTGLDVMDIGSGTYKTTAAPEIGAYLPVVGAILLYGSILVARRRSIRIRGGNSPT